MIYSKLILHQNGQALRITVYTCPFYPRALWMARGENETEVIFQAANLVKNSSLLSFNQLTASCIFYPEALKKRSKLQVDEPC